MRPNPTRRGIMLAGAAALISSKSFASTPACVLASEQEEGPYYVDGAKLRRDITEGKPGVPVTLRVALVDSRSCAPLSDAALDIWHCDASGVYSGFTSANPGGRGQFRPGGRGPRHIDDTRFLRGVQLTGAQGVAEFTTLYPGWYAGRAIHIHLKVHLGGEPSRVAHTGQLFFPEDVTEGIARMQPYADRLRVHRTTQQEDRVFTGQGGSGGMVHLERIRNGSNADGFVATVTVAIDPA